MLKKSITKANSGVAAFVLFSFWLLLYGGYYHWKHPSISSAVLHIGHLDRTIDLPFSEPSSKNVKRYAVSIRLDHAAGQNALFRVIPDDCADKITVNAVDVDLSKISRMQRCDYRSGFEFDFTPYLQMGENVLRFEIADRGGSRAFSMERLFGSMEAKVLKAMLLAWAFWLAFGFSRKLGFSVAVSLLVGLGLALRFYYLGETPWSLRTHDVEGHIEYIRLIAGSLGIPGADECWVCYHPPLYYLLGAMVYQTFAGFGEEVALTGLQVLSMTLNFGFVMFVLLSIRLFVRHALTFFMLAAVVVFWPSLILHSVRIGNDALIYFAYAGAFYAYLYWLRTHRGLAWMITLAVAAMLAKMNGVLVMAVLGLSFLIRVAVLRAWKPALRPIALTVTVFVLAVGVTMLWQAQRSSDELVGNVHSLNGKLYVGNAPKNYLTFDYTSYVNAPFTNPWRDGYGRQYFWNYFLKTSLFGEFNYGGNVSQMLGVALSLTYLLMWMAVLYGVWRLRTYEALQSAPFLLNALILLAGAIYLRYSVPAACSNDFRYVAPLLISIVYFFGYTLESLRKEGAFAYWVLAVGAMAFAAMSAAFILSV